MSLHRAPAAALYSGLSGNHLLGDVHALSSPLIGLANLLFLQESASPLLGRMVPSGLSPTSSGITCSFPWPS
jgi:hypothetical protein